jgi:hypothetical protein
MRWQDIPNLATLRRRERSEPWVTSFGGHAVVLETEELGRAIAVELEHLIKVYRSQPIKT